MRNVEKPWKNLKQFKVMLIASPVNCTCAGNTEDELHQDIGDKIVEHNLERIDFGFGWIGALPAPQGWATMHIHNAIKKHFGRIEEAAANLKSTRTRKERTRNRVSPSSPRYWPQQKIGRNTRSSPRRAVAR